MAGHKFEVGQVVRFSPRKGMFPAGAQAYTSSSFFPLNATSTNIVSRVCTRRSSGSREKANVQR